MKKNILLVAASIALLFASCEKEITSLEGAYWRGCFAGEGGKEGPVWEVSFSSSIATVSRTLSDGFQEIDTGRYYYNPPEVTIEVLNVDSTSSTGYWYNKNVGTIKGKTMTLRFQPTDIIWELELKKQ